MLTDNALQLAYGIPGILIYFAVIQAMVAMRRVLNRSFVAIFIIAALINIATWLNSWLSFRLYFEPGFKFFYDWTDRHKFVGSALLYLVPQFYFSQNVCVLLLTYDRYEAIYATVRNIEWWNNWYGAITAFALAVSIAVNALSKYSIEGHLFFDNTSASEGLWGNPPLLAELVQLAYGVVIFIACSILNIFSLKQLVLIHKTTMISKEISFFLISFSIFIAQVLNLTVVLLYTIILATPNQKDDFILSLRSFTTFVMFFTSDLFSIGPAL